MKAQHKLARTLLFCAFFLPASYLVFLIQRYGVDIPFLEQWNVAVFFEQLSQGSLAPADLFAQQNEYRQFFPHVLIVVLGWLTNWNVKYELFIIFLFACIISLSIYRLGGLTLHGVSRVRRVAVFFLSNLLIFSPMQYENWLYGIQIVYLMPIACIVVGVLVAYTGASAKVKFLICACLSVISSFSAPNGLLSWVVLLPPLLLTAPRPDATERKWLVIGWTTCMALSVAVYFYGYQAPPSHPTSTETFQHPLRMVLYFFSFLGTPLWAGTLWVTAGAGVLLTFVYGLVCFWLWKNRSDRALIVRSAGWLMLGAFSLLTGVLVTYGRSGFGLRESETARYIAFSLYLAVAVAHLAPLISFRSKDQADRLPFGKLASRLAVVGLMLALAAQARLYPIGTLAMMSKWIEHKHEKACLLFVNVLHGDCLSERALSPDILKHRANALNKMGYLRPGLMTGDSLQDIEGVQGEAGAFEELVDEGDGSFSAVGWARLPGSETPADAVLLASEKSDGDPVVFRLSEANAWKDYSVMRLKELVSPDLRWRARFSTADLPGDPLTITAWSFDAETGKAYRLGRPRLIRRPE